MKSRVVLILASFALFWGLLLVRIFILQMLPHRQLEKLEARQYETTIQVEGRRGSIVDRNGTTLAMSVPAYSLYADPQLTWPKRMEIARSLQKSLGLKSRDFLKLVKDKNRRFVWIERQLSYEKMESVKNLKLQGLGFIEEPVRVYPDADILKPILGVVGRSGIGLEGAEKQFDRELRGNPKKILVRRDARGRPLQINGLLVTEVEEGSDLHLTINRELQYVLHRELKKTVADEVALGAVGVILDAQTSEILAIDSIGRPIGGEQIPSENWRNRPILEAFEPGSTMKTFIVAAGLQKKKWQPNTKFNCEKGQLKIGRRTIGEADASHRFGWLSVSEILAVSSNIGITKMAFAMGESNVKQILSAFGFGAKTGVDLPGESSGILQKGTWSQHLLSNVSFGHGMTATPLQIANAYATIANGGLLKAPRVRLNLPSTFNSDAAFSERRILSEAEAKTLRLLLAGVTAPGGTGVSASVPGYPVAGKTGTAQKVNPVNKGYLPGVYISSFVGMIPANDPKFVIYVAIDAPQKHYYGSQVAGPLFSRIANFAVRHENLAPQWLSAEQAKGLLPTLAETHLESPIATEILEGVKSNQPQKSGPLTPAAMPNLEGLTLREVQEHLQGWKLKVQLSGSGRVSRFEPSMGTPIQANDSVRIWFTP